MRLQAKEIHTVRELAKRYMEIALSDKHVRMRMRFKDSNDLKIVRPPLIIEEVPWYEMNINGELNCICENEQLRSMELFFRRRLFAEKYFKCDNFIEPVWTIGKSFSSTGYGFSLEETRLATDSANKIVSHAYKDVLEDERSLEKYHDPVITAHPEKDEENKVFAESVLDGIMPVVLRGIYATYDPWDILAQLRGVEPILFDMYDRPEHLHNIMKLFIRGMNLEMNQLNRLGLFEANVTSLHATPGAVTLPHEVNPQHFTVHDTWFRTKAQMFGTVSPDAHYEFDMQYTIPLANRCAFTYYGCCEPLHDRIDQLKQYSNLRKIGCSPWANVEKMAEELGKNYVLSRKPNPAYVATSTDPEQIRKEISETVKLCIKYGCPCDIVLKDISTVSYKPQNLFVWAATASAVLDEFYGVD